jgi:hypothetical protein
MGWLLDASRPRSPACPRAAKRPRARRGSASAPACGFVFDRARAHRAGWIDAPRLRVVNHQLHAVAYVLDAVEVKAGETAATFRGLAPEGMIGRFGVQGEPVAAANRTIEPGRGA